MRRTGLSLAILAAGVVAGLASLSSSGDDPAPVPPLPTYCTWDVEQASERRQPTLTGASAAEPGLVWAVGEGGTILFHDGVSWAPQPSGTANNLRGVSALDRHHVWAVGDGGTILYEHGSWTQETCDGTASLTGVSALATANGWGAAVSGDLGLVLSKAQSALEGSVLNVKVNNYLSDPLSFSHARNPYCVNSYTLPEVPAAVFWFPGRRPSPRTLSGADSSAPSATPTCTSASIPRAATASGCSG